MICTPAAASVIKTYSPNLMVHPLMRQSPHNHHEDPDPESIAAPITALLPRLHVLVAGPGLGRDPLMHATLSRVLRAARRKAIPLVLDADALLLVQKDPELVRGYPGAVLTPNVVEFGRLCEALGIDADEEAGAQKGDKASESARVEALARALRGVTVVQKGRTDYVSNGDVTLAVDVQGGRKRSGGQGDTLTGSVATFLAWRKAYLDGLWDVGGEKLSDEELVGLAAFAGSAITKVSFVSLADPTLASVIASHRAVEGKFVLTSIGMLEAGLRQKGAQHASERPHRRGPSRLHDPLRRGGHGRWIKAMNGAILRRRGHRGCVKLME